MFNIFNPKIMKKYFFPALLGAIALSGPLAFTSCSSDEDVLNEKNPNYNAKTNEVTTQFVFNVSNGNTSTTRQSEAATQASSSLTATNFRGIDHSYIMCFKQDGADGKSLSDTATATKSFDMSRVVTAGSLDNEHSRRVLEMSLPLNTNTMLFYGRAIQTENNTSDYNKYGHLDDYTVTDKLANVNFQLGRRLTTENKTKFQKIQTLLAAVLSCIINTNRGNTAVLATGAPAEGVAAYGFDLPADYKANMTWAEYNAATSPADNGALRPLEIKLKNVYKEMTTIQTAEVRNASGFALKETVKQLWSIVNSVRCATPTSKEEALAKYMADRIDNELDKYFKASVPTDGGSVTGVSIRDASVLISALASDNYWPSSGGTKPSSSSFDNINTLSSTDLGIFPEQFELPQGSTHIKFDDTKKTFYYVTNYNSSAVGGGTFTVDDYYYPAELCYFGNSPLRVSDTEHVVGDYPESVSLWNTDGSWSSGGWTVGHVQSSTRSVAMKNDINYGTSLLKITIGYNTTTLKDNNKAIQQRDYGVTETDKDVHITDTSFKLVGVIVGDQWPKVGWNFLPKTSDTSTDYRKGYIYDNQIQGSGVIPATGTSTANYTLVFDNYQDMTATDATNKQPRVYIALEFENNTGMDFFGKDNLIANGSHFYLIGELDPSSKTAPAKPAYHALPPYKFAGTYSGDATKTVPRVFIQDHMTTANFKIGQNSLKYAYLTVPDLRSSSVTLGLSVDLNWSTGITFDEVLLGGN
jgi:hypothetical protein